MQHLSGALFIPCFPSIGAIGACFRLWKLGRCAISCVPISTKRWVTHEPFCLECTIFTRWLLKGSWMVTNGDEHRFQNPTRAIHTSTSAPFLSPLRSTFAPFSFLSPPNNSMLRCILTGTLHAAARDTSASRVEWTTAS